MTVRALCLLLAAGCAWPQTAWENLDRSIVKVMNSKNEVIGAGLVTGIVNGTVYILTARHVADEASPARVRFFEQQDDYFDAAPGPRTEKNIDLAMLVVRSKPDKPAPAVLTKFMLGDPKKIAVGERVTAIGHPNSESWLPALNNEILATNNAGDFRIFRFKNTAMDTGNSGGPVFLADGTLIGIAQTWTPLYVTGFRIGDARQIVKEAWHLSVNYLQTDADLDLQKGKQAYASNNWAAALPLFQLAAQKDDSEAMGYLCTMYRAGQGVKAEPAQAADWCRKSSQSGDPQGMFGLGVLYESGSLASPKPQEDAAAAFKKAAEWGHAEAMLRYAKRLDSGSGLPKDEKKAIEWLQRAADHGNGEAANELGVKYALGRGVPVDLWKARARYEQGDKAGDPWATSNLGLYYELGIGGVARDAARAFQLYKKSADASCPVGMYHLAQAYDVGLTSKDPALADQWYEKAADAGLADAQLSWARRLYARAAKDTVLARRRTLETRAFGYLSKAAASGNADALYEMSLSHRKGRGTGKDTAAADAELAKAAAAGNVAAMYDLGSAASDPAVAVQWLSKAGEAGSVPAMIAVGVRLWESTGPIHDDAKAAGWFEKAATKGSAAGMYNLGFAWQSGRGVSKIDRATACVWFAKAADADKSLGQAQMAAGDCLSQSDPAKAQQLYHAAAALKVTGASDKEFQLAARLAQPAGTPTPPANPPASKTSKPKPSPPPSIGTDAAAPELTVYIYGRHGLNYKPSVYVDGLELARIRGDGWFAIRVRAGKHEFCIHAGKCVTFDLSKPGDHFLRVENKGFGSYITVEVVEDGAERIRECSRIDASLFKNSKFIFFPRP